MAQHEIDFNSNTARFTDTWTYNGMGGYISLFTYTNTSNTKERISSIQLWLGTGSGYFYTPDQVTGNGKTVKLVLATLSNSTYTNRTAIVSVTGQITPTSGYPNYNSNNWRQYTITPSSDIAVNAGATITFYARWDMSGSTGNVLCIDKGQWSTRKSYINASAYTVTLSYSANGGSGAPSSQQLTPGVAGTVSSTAPTRTGYTFDSWNTKSNGSGTSYSSGSSITINSATTLYAIWKYTVSYNANGGSGAPSNQTARYGTDITLSSTIPTLDNNEFVEWNTKSDGSGDSYNPGTKFSYTHGNTTLYAIWTSKPPVWIRRDGQWKPLNASGLWIYHYDSNGVGHWQCSLPIWIYHYDAQGKGHWEKLQD